MRKVDLENAQCTEHPGANAALLPGTRQRGRNLHDVPGALAFGVELEFEIAAPDPALETAIQFDFDYVVISHVRDDEVRQRGPRAVEPDSLFHAAMDDVGLFRFDDRLPLNGVAVARNVDGSHRSPRQAARRVLLFCSSLGSARSCEILRPLSEAFQYQ
ncbi:MAG: hypothetical protein ACJ8D0_17435 [Xanthobacteraceae bacterium]